ncbi:hypothetical protein [Streptomyces blattellae]|uniref:hypothetical protein n=1 Tax=Streptomyces blattellae TaxID=2569855 RepID=UPI0012B94F96|nr:hypothetical protein [Streptomyces blattellae]
MYRPLSPDLRPPASSRTLPTHRGRRLTIPPHLPAHLGYDAVGTLRELGQRILGLLPRVGCVYADDQRWWWIVPAGSQIDITWPPSTRYAVDARVADVSLADVSLADPSWAGPRPKPAADRPRLIHTPSAGSPYTPPLPLYFLTCRLTGTPPRWSPSGAN